MFRNVDEERVAARIMRQLRQRGSAAQYYSRFQQLSAHLDWDNTALASVYYEGLNDQVKDEMGINPPGDLKKLIDQSIRTDGWLYERRMEKRGGLGAPRFYTQQKRDYGDPMELDSMEHGRPSRPNKPRFKGNPTPNRERDRRRRDNLCYNYGKSGHRAKECDNRAQGLHMMGNNQTGIAGKKADTAINIKARRQSKAQGELKGTGAPEDQIYQLEGRAKAIQQTMDAMSKQEYNSLRTKADKESLDIF